MKCSKHFKRQFTKYLNDSLSPEEASELMNDMKNNLSDRKLSRILKSSIKRHEFPGLTYDEMRDRSYRRFMQAIGKEQIPSANTKDSITGNKRSFGLLPAAAAVLIIVVIGSVWFVRKASYFTHETEQISDLAPGGNKAILTLTDGRIIILDSVANGVLAKEDNVTISKTDDGQIIYTSSGKTKIRSNYNTITTPRGGEYRVMLPDSTMIWLNAESAIRFPVAFNDKERRVEISGEVYLEVRKNFNMPFHVVTDDVEIVVLGTSFNVKAYKDENAVETTLLEGSLKVITEEVETILIPGQQLAFDKQGGQISIHGDVNTEEIVAWKNGLFIFNRASIEKIMFQISKWYNVEIVYSGTKSTDTFSGMIDRNSPVSKILQIIKEAGVECKIYEDKIIVGK